jgi:hypothetical protein
MRYHRPYPVIVPRILHFLSSDAARLWAIPDICSRFLPVCSGIIGPLITLMTQLTLEKPEQLKFGTPDNDVRLSN